MRFLILFLCSISLAGAEARIENEKPGEREFLGCNKYPPDKKFRWGVRGEVGPAELVFRDRATRVLRMGEAGESERSAASSGTRLRVASDRRRLN